jgi:hypothetical protein
VLFIVFQSLVTVSLFTIMKIYLLHRLKLPKHMVARRTFELSKICSKERSAIFRNSKKSFLRERSVSFLLKSRSEGNAEPTVKNKR